MDFINDLGVYGSLAEVWDDYPNGGLDGDYVTVYGIRYGWNKYVRQWETDDIINSAGVQTRRVDGNMSVARDLYVGGVLYCRGVKYRCKGFFTTLEGLKSACPNPEPGDWAIVGDSIPGEIYHCKEPGVWTDSGQKGGDGEIDLTEYAKKEELQKAYAELLKIINGMYANMGIVKSYISYRDMAADRYPKNSHGDPLKEGAQAVISGDNENRNKVYRWNNPGWTYLYRLSDPDLSEVWKTIYQLHAEARLSTSPSIIEKGTANTIVLSWSLLFGGDNIGEVTALTLTENGKILDVDGMMTRRLVREGVDDTTAYMLEVTLPYGAVKQATAKVSAYYPVYIGTSAKDQESIASADVLGMKKQSPRATPSGSYSLQVPEDAVYVYICVPSGMAVKGVTMGGQPFGFTPARTVVVEGKGNYFAYRSVWAQDSGTITFTVNG